MIDCTLDSDGIQFVSSTLTQASSQLLEPAELQQRHLEKLLARLASHQIDYADLYFQSQTSESWSLEHGIVNGGAFSHRQGAGIRAVSGEKTGFAYVEDISDQALTRAADAARGIAKSGNSGSIQILSSVRAKPRYQADNPIPDLPEDRKIALLQQADKAARAADPRIKEVNVSLSSNYDVCLIAATDGTLAADLRPLLRFDVSVIAEDNQRRERGHGAGGGRYPVTWLTSEGRVEALALEAVRQALVNLESVSAPAGPMPVVLGNGWCGVLLHEAVGHGLEGDAIRKGTSNYAGRKGEAVASAHCTVIDDGTLAQRRGSLTVDDEGTPSRENILIENGILKNYMQDKLNARLMDLPVTGNARRESYSHLPMPRMTNTFMRAGEHDPQEIIASVDKGIYAVHFGGGQVDTTSGRFVFAASEAYMIEGGRVTRPVKGATLIGNGPDVMTRISMVGRDLALDSGVGICGKMGQAVPVGVGQPTVRIDEVVVGGTG